MARRFRLLPLLAAVAGVALAARAIDVWHGFAVMAQEKPAAQALPGQSQPWAGLPAQGQAAESPDEAPAADPTPPDEVGGAPDGGFQLPPDPLTMTDEEVDLLQSLSERRKEIERRARRLEEREALLQAAERRIEDQVAGLQALRKTIEDLLKEHEQLTESQYDSLVKIYENMKPKDAARIFEELEMGVLLPVVERMKERKIAPILAKMDADKAKTITTELAQRRKLPEGQ